MSRLHTHYDNLKVARSAPPEVIRAAYKTLVQKYHPDRNPGDARAAEIMAILNASYAVLSDPERRQAHDAWIERQESVVLDELPADAPESSGNDAKVSAQSGVSERSSIMLSVVRSIASYWIFFALAGFLLYSCISHKSSPPPGPKPYVTSPPSEAAIADAVQASSDSGALAVDPAAAAAEAAAAAADAAVASSTQDSAAEIFLGENLVSAKKPPGCEVPISDPNGRPWPAYAKYVDGFDILNDDGYSTITIDNSQNDSNVFVKIVSLSGKSAYPIRSLYVGAYGKFTAENVSAGTYDIRYRDLTSGCLFRSEQFSLTESQVEDGVRYSAYSLTLYKVADGNVETYPLSESEFE